jgi:hypothetical protein
MVSRRFLSIVSCVCVLLLQAFTQEALPAGDSAFSGFEFYVTDDASVGLYKPKGWQVGTQAYPNGKMVFVTDPRDLCLANMVLLEKVDPSLDSVAFARATLTKMKKQMTDLKVMESRSSVDRTRTVVKIERKGPNGIGIRGRYCFNVKVPLASMIGYESPARDFKKTVPILLTILSNIHLLDNQAYRKMEARMKRRSPSVLKMHRVTARDGTCRLLVPAGWNLQAGHGRAICTSPDKNTGFIFTTIQFVGQSRIPYFNSSNIPGDLRHNYMRPVDALVMAMRHLGSRNHKVLERYANTKWAGQASRFLNRGTDAELALISCTSKNGAPVVGFYDVLGLHPTNAGQWAIIVMGLWAPEDQFPRLLPSLMKMAGSFSIDQRWASNYVRQGMENLKRMMRDTSSMMSRYAEEMRQSSLAGHQNRMKSSDFTSYKFSTYMRGEQEWVTGIEGGKIYSSDHHGLSSGGRTLIEGPAFNYYNYRGDAEYGHIPVDTSREVFEAVMGGR